MTLPDIQIEQVECRFPNLAISRGQYKKVLLKGQTSIVLTKMPSTVARPPVR